MKAYNPPFLILKPKPGTLASSIIRGDEPGVVGVEEGIDMVVSYEGNLYDVGNLSEWKDRVIHAADRLETGYPTIARSVLPKEQFEVIGTIEHCFMSRAWNIKA